MAEKVIAPTKAPETKQICSNFNKRKPGFYSLGSPANRRSQLQKTVGNQAVQKLIKSRTLQAKLRIGQPNDTYEQEADRVAEQIMRMPDPVLQRKCTKCGKDEKTVLQAKNSPGRASLTRGQGIPPIVRDVLRSPGKPLDTDTRAYMEPRFGYDFSRVRVHTDTKAGESAQGVNALAYTVGQNIVFGEKQSKSSTVKEKMLMAHELAHVIQQDEASTYRKNQLVLSPVKQLTVQRTPGDGHDLTSPRFSRLLDLEAAYDDEIVISVDNSSSGRGVQAIQQALHDLGYALPLDGADGVFGKETKAAVKSFQSANSLVDDGEVGKLTMSALDKRFGAPKLPSSVSLSAPWTGACVRSVICPWSPHTIEVLKTRITLKSFDSIYWADEMWNGKGWVTSLFPGGGYNNGSEIGVLNSSCKNMSETLYHEILHAEQPSAHKTTKQREAYAYRIGEEFSIAMGLSGRSTLRSTDAQGRQYANPTKVETFVKKTYPSIPVGGGSDEIIGKATSYGHVRVQKPDGTIYTRPAVVGEKVPGPMTTVNEVTHSTAGWKCP